VYTAGAQGSFTPEGADLSFPRTLLDRREIAQVQARLSSTATNLKLYEDIYRDATRTVPTQNAVYAERFRRSIIAREAAFVYLMDRKPVDGELVPLLTNERDELLAKVIGLLEAANPVVDIQEGFSFYYSWQFRTNELAMYLVAYDLLRGADVAPNRLAASAARLQEFAGNFYKRTDPLYPFPGVPGLKIDFYSYNANNHGVMYSSTLGLAGIVLGDLTSPDEAYQPQQWIQAGMWNLDNTLWRAQGLLTRVSDSTGVYGYAEGPNYFDYGFKNAMPFLRAAGNFLPEGHRTYTFRKYTNPIRSGTVGTLESRSIRNPWHDPKYHGLLEWLNCIRMPDGRYPAVHDSGLGFKTQLPALFGISKYNVPSLRSNYRSVWVRTQYLCTGTAEGSYDQPLFQALPDAGSLVFRSAYNDPAATYMHLIGKQGIALSGAKAHHQADATSMQLYYAGEDLILDPGYPGAPQRLATATATSHNLVLVDGQGPEVANGEFVDRENEAFIEHTADLPGLDYGEIRSGWKGADITRKTAFIDDAFFVVQDVVRADQPHDFTFQLHGHGLMGSSPDSKEGALVTHFDNDSYTYTRGDHNLLGVTLARGGVDDFEIRLDSAAISGYRQHSTTLAHERSTSATEFLTLLYPYRGNDEPSVERHQVNSDASMLVVATDDTHTIIASQGTSSLLSLEADEPTIPTVRANGGLIIAAFDANQDLRSFLLEGGDTLSIEGELGVHIDETRDLALARSSESTFAAHIDDAATLVFTYPIALVPTGPAVEGFDYDGKRTTVLLKSAGDFTLTADPNQASSTQELAGGVVQISPNPSDGIFRLAIDADLQHSEVRVEVFTPSGKTLLTMPVSARSTAIDLHEYPQGIYFLRVRSGTHTATFSLLKAR